MRTGIATTDFPTTPLVPLFRRIRKLGFDAVQLSVASLSEADFTPDGQIEIPPAIDGALLDRIKAQALENALEIVSLNGTFNAAHPDAAVREEGIKRMEVLAHAAKELGCGIITLCSGTRCAHDLWTRHAQNDTAAAWADMIATMRGLCAAAARRGITLAVETEAGNVVSTPEKARRMLDEAACENLKMVIDCANLFHAGEARRENAKGHIQRAFDFFGRDIVLAHGKDIAESDGIDFCATGEGIVDFPLFLRLLKEVSPPCDMILHGIYEEEKMPAGIEIIRQSLPS